MPSPSRPAAALSLVAVAAVTGLLVSLLVLPPVLAAGLAAREASRYYQQLPVALEEPPLPQRSVIVDADGTPFAQFFAYDRVPVPGTRIAPVLREAVVATEDTRFYDHRGYDPAGIARALRSNAAADGGLQGASTITQQYVKNVLTLHAELGSTDPAAVEADTVSVARKLRELKLAVQLTASLDKDELLTRYLNIAYFGSGAYGVEAAARRYYSTTAADLTLNQAAMLAGLLKNPTGYDPLRNPDAAIGRRNVVLGRMLAEHKISAADHDRVTALELRLRPSRPRTGCTTSPFPFYCEQVLHLLRNDPAFGATEDDRRRLLAIGGLRISTPLDRTAMRTAAQATSSTIPAEHRVATAVAVVTPGTGHVTAIGTNRRHGTGPGATQIVLPTTPAFQPGSTFKLFTLAAALDAGMPLSTRLPGGATHTSTTLDNPGKGYYSNSAGSESNVTLTRATQLSMNTAFVQLEEKVGVRAIAEMAHRLGVTSVTGTGPEAPGPREGSFTLGTAEVSVVDMANAYATVAAGGRACPAVFITAVRTATGQRVPTPDTTCRRVLDEAAADTLAHILGTVVSHGTGAPAAFGRPAAGKTGTTENLGAAWFAGFTPQYASAVWVGDPRGPSHQLYDVLGYSRVYGGTLPATVWRKTMAGIHAGLPVRALPQPNPGYVATSGGALLPRVVGQPRDQAVLRLREAGARLGTVTFTGARPGQRDGVVVAQTPSGGGSASGTRVDLVVTGR